MYSYTLIVLFINGIVEYWNILKLCGLSSTLSWFLVIQKLRFPTSRSTIVMKVLLLFRSSRSFGWFIAHVDIF